MVCICMEMELFRMLYCFDNKLDFDYSKREMAVAKINNNGIFYDSTLKTFLDYEGNEVDIKDMLLFPRTGWSQIYDMNYAIVEHGGHPILTNEEIDIVVSWPNYFKTIRGMRIVKGKDLLVPSIIDDIERSYGNEIFFKTKDKDFHDVISIDLLRDPECAFYKTILHHLEDEFIISEEIDVVNDNYGVKEYRCFVVNGELMNISRMTVSVFHSIEQDVLNKAMEVVNKLSDPFPKSYSFDLLEYEKDGERIIDVSEFNPIHEAGLYLYNSVMSKSEDILHSNMKSISYEFIDMLDQCSFDGSVINDRKNEFDGPNTFSNDLISICINGDVGLQYTTLYIDSSDYSRHEGMLNDFAVIDSDAELFSAEENYEDSDNPLLDKVNALLKKI